MPVWASTLVGVVVGAGLTGLVTLLTLRWQLGEERQRREEDALRDRREKGAAAVGPVRALLGDAEPDPPMLLAGNPGVSERWQELVARWEPLRDPLVVYVVGHPSRKVVEVGNDLATAVGRTLQTTSWALRMSADPDMRGGIELKEIRAKALEMYSAAIALADELLELVREDSSDASAA